MIFVDYKNPTLTKLIHRTRRYGMSMSTEALHQSNLDMKLQGRDRQVNPTTRTKKLNGFFSDHT